MSGLLHDHLNACIRLWYYVDDAAGTFDMEKPRLEGLASVDVLWLLLRRSSARYHGFVSTATMVCARHDPLQLDIHRMKDRTTQDQGSLFASLSG